MALYLYVQYYLVIFCTILSWSLIRLQAPKHSDASFISQRTVFFKIVGYYPLMSYKIDLVGADQHKEREREKKMEGT